MPSVFYAGDSLLLSVSVDNYPASDGWTLTYYLGSDISFTSTASGAAHSFSLTPSTTAQWPKGDYQATARVSNGTQTVTVWAGAVSILSGSSQDSLGADRLPWFFAARDTMSTVLAGKAGRDVINSTIAGQQISRLSPREAVEFYNWLNGMCINWQSQQNAAAGITKGNLVKVRFTRP